MTAPDSTAVPFGYCHCGCGQATRLAPQSITKLGWVKGEPIKFVRGHSGGKTAITGLVNPGGLCRCGCGKKTSIATRSDARKGSIKGQPRLYLLGHNRSKRQLFVGTHRVDPETGCWVWLQGTDRDGYALAGYRKLSKRAARIYYEHFRSPIPPGLQVDHLCRNRICVNPWHLEAVSIPENVRRGNSAKLTYEAAEQIRTEFAEGNLTRSQLAKRFGVSRSNISRILNGNAWL